MSDGHTIFVGTDNYQIESEPKYALLTIAEESDSVLFEKYLREHQQGKSDYPTFSGQAANTGVEKWVVDITNMTCTYFDKTGNIMLLETIPG